MEIEGPGQCVHLCHLIRSVVVHLEKVGVLYRLLAKVEALIKLYMCTVSSGPLMFACCKVFVYVIWLIYLGGRML